MGKKKPFIDKKTASTFHVVRRSQRDVGGYFDEKTGLPLDMPQEFILMPSPQTQTQQRIPSKTDSHLVSQTTDTSSWDRAKMQLKHAGLMDDYDYDQHTRPITGSGIFIASESGTISVPTILPTQQDTLDMEPLIQELDRQLDAIALTATCIDEDIAHALFDEYDDGEYEELTDDFCILASQEPVDDDDDEDERKQSQAFDFDAHIAKLLEKAKREDGNHTPENHSWWEQNQHEFHGVKARYRRDVILEEEDDEELEFEEEDMDEWEEDAQFLSGTVHGRTDEEEKALCEKFQQTLAEYDDSDEEEEEDDMEGAFTTPGLYQIEGDVRFDALLDEYLTEKKDEIFIEGIHKTALERKRNGGGSSFMVLCGKQMVREEDMKEGDEPGETLDNILAEADQALMDPVMDLPPEEVLIDGKSYFAEKIQNPWDCESILSTYSNLDNNPAIIGRRKRSSTTKKSAHSQTGESTHEQPIQVILSRKTGLPLLQTNVMSQTILEDPSVTSVNLGVARRKDETKDDKRLRKDAAKEQKQISRVQKKMMKTIFQAELSKHCGISGNDDIGGVSVFRYT